MWIFVDRFLNKLGIQSIDIAGNSLGGQIAWNYALARPERVRRLVMIDAAGYPREDNATSGTVLRLARLPLVNSVLTMLTPRSLIADSLREVYGDPSKLTDDVIDRYYELARRPGKPSGLRRAREGNEHRPEWRPPEPDATPS